MTSRELLYSLQTSTAQWNRCRRNAHKPLVYTHHLVEVAVVADAAAQ